MVQAVFGSGVLARFSALISAPSNRPATPINVPPACEKMKRTSGQRVAVSLTIRLAIVRIVSIGYSSIWFGTRGNKPWQHAASVGCT